MEFIYQNYEIIYQNYTPKRTNIRWHRGLKRLWGQEIAIFRQTVAYFRRRICGNSNKFQFCLRAPTFPQNRRFPAKIVGKKFANKKKIFRKAKT